MARAWLTWWVLLAALYLLLVDTVKPAELVAGAFAATLGATGAVIVRRQRLTLLHPRPRHFRGVWRHLLGLFTDIAPLTRALLMRRAGTLHEEPFPDAKDPTARAVAEALGSLAPATIVVAIDDDTIVTHRL